MRAVELVLANGPLYWPARADPFALFADYPTEAAVALSTGWSPATSRATFPRSWRMTCSASPSIACASICAR